MASINIPKISDKENNPRPKTRQFENSADADERHSGKTSRTAWSAYE